MGQVTKKSNIDQKTTVGNRTATAEVLYQKLGNRWYAFSLINDEVFVGSISQDEIDQSVVSPQAQPNANPTPDKSIW